MGACTSALARQDSLHPAQEQQPQGIKIVSMVSGQQFTPKTPYFSPYTRNRLKQAQSTQQLLEEEVVAFSAARIDTRQLLSAAAIHQALAAGQQAQPALPEKPAAPDLAADAAGKPPAASGASATAGMSGGSGLIAAARGSSSDLTRVQPAKPIRVRQPSGNKLQPLLHPAAPVTTPAATSLKPAVQSGPALQLRHCKTCCTFGSTLVSQAQATELMQAGMDVALIDFDSCR